MASRQTINTFKLSLGVLVPLLVDFAYQEGYVVPFTIPSFYTKSRLKELSKPMGVAFGMPPSLTFTRYRTENPWHARYVHAKKSFWRYNVMWPFLGMVSTALQLSYMIKSLRVRWTAGAVTAIIAMVLTWTGITVEGNARKMYLDEMQEKVLKEESVAS